MTGLLVTAPYHLASPCEDRIDPSPPIPLKTASEWAATGNPGGCVLTDAHRVTPCLPLVWAALSPSRKTSLTRQTHHTYIMTDSTQPAVTDELTPNTRYCSLTGDDSAAYDSPTYKLPSNIVGVCLHVLGFQQRMSPNADCDHASEAQKLSQSLYGMICISHQQHEGPTTWESTRKCREYAFDETFYVPELFAEFAPYETPDDMFDDVEADLASGGYFDSFPPERDCEYVDDI